MPARPYRYYWCQRCDVYWEGHVGPGVNRCWACGKFTVGTRYGKARMADQMGYS